VLEVAQPAAGSLAVISGPGPIGLLCAQVARAAGADVIVLGTSADADRFALARRLGFERLIDVQAVDPVEAVGEMSGGRAPDLLVEAAGAAGSLDGCLRLAPRGGTVLQIGLYGKPVPVAMDTLVLKEIRLLGSFSSTPTSWPTAIDLLGRGAVLAEPLVTSKRPLSEWAAAFDAARSKGEGKILLTP
jgi:L-iditol 2-dehydrogenase